MERLTILGNDTLENAKMIMDGVKVEGVDIQIIGDRGEFGNSNKVPESVPQGKVLIEFRVPRNITIEVMNKIFQALNPTEI